MGRRSCRLADLDRMAGAAGIAKVSQSVRTHVPAASVRTMGVPACIAFNSFSIAAIGWPCELAPQEIGVVRREKTVNQSEAEGFPARPP